MNKKPIFIITGPTGSGKSALSLKLAQTLPIEIINVDIGSFYTPLTIGTAKPDWRNAPIPHHMFDVLDAPGSLNVVQYKERMLSLVHEIEARGNIACLVGGSMFYIHSLFFPPADSTSPEQGNLPASVTWQALHDIDPERAKDIKPTDTYRIKRALEIYSTGHKPSTTQPTYKGLDRPVHIILVDRDRDELYQRIDKRTNTMLQRGWIDEVRGLMATPWKEFILQKKIIGYNEIVHFLDADDYDHDQLVQDIQKRTRAYAKRQWTFWRRMKRMLEIAQKENAKYTHGEVIMDELNLTLSDLDLYIKGLDSGSSPE
jgi:tRNA dimethylallyltransferase